MVKSSTARGQSIRPNQQGESGFTLLELIVVSAIVAIVAALVIPNLVSSRKAANEAHAIGNLRALASAQNLFRVSDLNGDGEQNFATEAEIDALELVEVPNGLYDYSMTLSVDRRSYTALAWPRHDINGDRWFFLDESGVIRYERGSAADASSPPIN